MSTLSEKVPGLSKSLSQNRLSVMLWDLKQYVRTHLHYQVTNIVRVGREQPEGFEKQLSEAEAKFWPCTFKTFRTHSRTALGSAAAHGPALSGYEPYPQQPPSVLAGLPTVGPMDDPLVDYSKTPFEVRCVRGPRCAHTCTIRL